MERNTRDPLKGIAKDLNKKLTIFIREYLVIPKSNFELQKVSKVTNRSHSRKFNPLPLRFPELYGIIAILLILMPEWIAGWWIKFVSHSSEDEHGHAIYDDHVPLYEEAGIPSVNLIDFKYPLYESDNDNAILH